MRKTEAPHKLRIVFDSLEEDGIEVTTQCSCKAGTGKYQHLAALFCLAALFIYTIPDLSNNG